jgi:hypothetical protein
MERRFIDTPSGLASSGSTGVPVHADSTVVAGTHGLTAPGIARTQRTAPIGPDDQRHPECRLDDRAGRPYLAIVRRSKSASDVRKSVDPAQGARMPSSDQPYRTSAFAHLCFLVAEALRTPAAGAPPAAAPTRLHALDRLDRWFWRQRQKDRERYLARATDVADVERRLRELERTPYY